MAEIAGVNQGLNIIDRREIIKIYLSWDIFYTSIKLLPCIIILSSYSGKTPCRNVRIWLIFLMVLGFLLCVLYGIRFKRYHCRRTSTMCLYIRILLFPVQIFLHMFGLQFIDEANSCGSLGKLFNLMVDLLLAEILIGMLLVRITWAVEIVPNNVLEPLPVNDIQRLPESLYTEPIDNQTNCSICLEDYIIGSNIRLLPCNHVYHKHCIDEWLMIKNECPLCRENIILDRV